MQIPIGFSTGIQCTLLCPFCKQENLHQTRVLTYFRDKENGPGNVTYSQAYKTHVERFDDDDKLPTRRDVIKIYFWCEHCGPDLTDGFDDSICLVMLQYKGNTFMYWEKEND